MSKEINAHVSPDEYGRSSDKQWICPKCGLGFYINVMDAAKCSVENGTVIVVCPYCKGRVTFPTL
jgi:uncharacterized protein YbaR (Trm112 family)